jgi:hypothetical protein
MPTKEPTKPAKAVGVRGQVPVWYVDREGNLCYPDCTAATTIHAWAGEFLQLSPEKKHMPDQLSAEHTPASSPSKAAPGMGVAAMVNGYYSYILDPFMDRTYFRTASGLAASTVLNPFSYHSPFHSRAYHSQSGSHYCFAENLDKNGEAN